MEPDGVVRTPVDVFKVDIYCCGIPMKKSDYVLTTYPAQYQYRCTMCFRSHTSHVDYPYIDYVPTSS